MALEQIEIRWRLGGEEQVLVIGADGVAHVSRQAPVAAPPLVAARPPGHARRGKGWTTEEEDRLASKLATVEDAAAIAAELGRSRGAVLARAVKLGLLEESEAGLRYPVVRAEPESPE